MNSSIRKLENLHIAFWLVKDTFWVLDFRILGVIMIFPTLFLAFYITYKFRKQVSELYHNLAVCFWILANTTWMIGEFYFGDTFRPYSTLFFITGLIIIAYYYLFIFRKVKLDSQD
ncbi:hypothetical protein [Daejeonella sp.]|uniref:hypothetical protein n=1 Tax=Daejeonella sp. TaxID=2805397 RepID=UPI0037C0CA73